MAVKFDIASLLATPALFGTLINANGHKEMLPFFRPINLSVLILSK